MGQNALFDIKWGLQNALIDMKRGLQNALFDMKRGLQNALIDMKQELQNALLGVGTEKWENRKYSTYNVQPGRDALKVSHIDNANCLRKCIMAGLSVDALKSVPHCIVKLCAVKWA